MLFQVLTFAALAAITSAAPVNATVSPSMTALPYLGAYGTDATNNTISTSHLEARGNSKGWIGSHWKAGCNNKPPFPPKAHGSAIHGARPYIPINKCVAFTPSTDFTGIYWGAGDDHVHALALYRTKDCTGPLIRLALPDTRSGVCMSTGWAVGIHSVLAKPALPGHAKYVGG